VGADGNAADRESSPAWPDELVAAYLMAQAICPDTVAPHDWEDALSEAIVRLPARVQGSAAPIEDPLAYVLQVAWNCLRRASGGRRELQADLELDTCEDGREPVAEHHLLLAQMWKRLSSARIRWTRRQREYLDHVRTGGHANAGSIARAMDCSRENILQLAHAIARKAQRHFAEKKSTKEARRKKPPA
jgi:hypothetical protein